MTLPKQPFLTGHQYVIVVFFVKSTVLGAQLNVIDGENTPFFEKK
jgi:hypothetical protein